MDPQKIWQAVLGELEVTLSKANFTTWFKSTALEDASGEVAIVRVPNGFTKEWLQRKYLAEILAALKKHAPGCKRIDFAVGTPTPVKPSAETAHAAPAQALADEVELEASSVGAPGNTFGNFVVGSSNQLACAASKAVAKRPGKTYNPLFLYGGAGLGKTHLMQAIGREVQQNTDAKVLYVTMEKFLNDMIAAISTNRMSVFKKQYRQIDVLLVDDIQFLAGKEGVQEEFFHTFNALHGDGKQVVISSDRPPKAIPTLEERLRSRFEWGMIADVNSPELETRVAILQTKARERGYEAPQEVVDYIARAIQQNIRELEGALIRVMAHAELTGEAPTAELAERVLGNILSARTHRTVSTNQIIEAVTRFYDVSVDQLRGPGRQKEIVKPRQMAMFLLREEANLSYPKIGREIGGRDHTTVIHAVEKMHTQTEINEPLRHELNLIKERLYA